MSADAPPRVLLDEILSRVAALPDKQRTAFAKHVDKAVPEVWVPWPGKQTAAYLCEADELFFGGAAGGGKTDLLFGLALTAHERSLILRRTNKESSKLAERLAEILGTRDGWNGQEDVWRLKDGRLIDIGGIQLEDDKQKYKGSPHDLICFDEVGDFTESQFRFVNIWCRSANAKQRCRIVAAGNPPTRAEGLWIAMTRPCWPFGLPAGLPRWLLRRALRRLTARLRRA